MLRFGDSHQHDSDEFITFIIGQLEIETRYKLTKNPLSQLDTSHPVGFVADRWGNRTNNTIISQYWYSLELHTFSCKSCQAKNYVVAEAERYAFPVPTDMKGGSLAEFVDQHFETLEVDSECDECGSRGKVWTKKLVRQPPLLRVVLQRADQTNTNKVITPMKFPLENWDFEQYALDGDSVSQIATLLGGEAAEGFVSDTVYSLYAVVCHAGTTLNSGHYVCYIKTDKGTWTLINDTRITAGISAASVERIFHTCENNFTPVQLYYRRVPK